MNWDYKHSLSIQIARQRCNISCGLRRWKWFIFKNVAASFHYFKVLLISVVLAMTNSHVQEEQAHGGCDIFPACQWRSYHEDLLPVSFRALSFLHGRLHGTGRVTCLLEELWVLTFPYFPRPTQRVYNPSSLPPIPRQATFLAILIYHMATLAAHPPSHQLLYWHLLEWRTTLGSLDKCNPSFLLPLEGSYRQALKTLWSLTVD